MRVLSAVLLLLVPRATAHPPSREPQALHAAAPAASFAWRDQLHAAKATGVLLDWQTGKLLSEEGPESAATPGSLLKPLLLTYALKHRIVSANTQVYCRRTLVVAGRSLPCSHPNDQPIFDAERALANSCNTWFASLARRMTARDLEAVLHDSALPYSSQHFNNADTRILTALGLENVTATPMQMARAYRRLLLEETHTSPVWQGLQGSVTYGMAHNAHLEKTEVLGKTGTAANPGEWWTHGWFAGAVPGRFVVVVYVPHGDGGTASAMAANALRQSLIENTR